MVCFPVEVKSQVAYIWKVCSPHMFLHVPAPLSPLPLHLPPPRAATVFSEPGNSKDVWVNIIPLINRRFGGIAQVCSSVVQHGDR